MDHQRWNILEESEVPNLKDLRIKFNRLLRVKKMGKFRPDHVKQIAQELVERFPEKFSVDFEINKQHVDTLTNSG